MVGILTGFLVAIWEVTVIVELLIFVDVRISAALVADFVQFFKIFEVG